MIHANILDGTMLKRSLHNALSHVRYLMSPLLGTIAEGLFHARGGMLPVRLDLSHNIAKYADKLDTRSNVYLLFTNAMTYKVAFFVFFIWLARLSYNATALSVIAGHYLAVSLALFMCIQLALGYSNATKQYLDMAISDDDNFFSTLYKFLSTVLLKGWERLFRNSQFVMSDDTPDGQLGFFRRLKYITVADPTEASYWGESIFVPLICSFGSLSLYILLGYQLLGLPMSTFFYAILPVVLVFSSFFNIIGSHDFSSKEERISSTALISQFDSHIKSSAISCSTKSVLMPWLYTKDTHA